MSSKPAKQKAGKARGPVPCDRGKSGTRGARTGARKARVARIRKEIENQTYETEGKLRIAISRLIDDVLAESPKGTS